MPASSSISPSLRLALHYVKDNMHCIIGLWGMGGVGKTHLLKQINNELCKGSTFNVVVSVTCSKESSEEKVQNEIINKLGLIKSDSVEQKHSTIFNFLKQKSFVLLLDDLWSRMNLETVGIPTPYGIVDNCKRKVVLTTRSEEVCQLMEVDKLMRVNVLDWNGAWSVFKEKVSEHTIESHPLILKYAVDVVKELGGLPLALITVGKAMNNRTDPSEWKDAVELLKQARLHDLELSATDKPMFEVLKFSYDKLKNDNLRQCFLHCSLWPEDFLIDKNDLVELWMGLGLIDERDITKAYQAGYNYISRLQAVCLLESTDNESQVKLHDVIRDMSLWIVSDQGIEQNKWIVRSVASNQSKVVIKKETEKISLMYNAEDVSFIPNSWDNRLTTFFFTWSSLNKFSVLEHQALSHLTILNLKGNRINVFPTEICHLYSLRFIDLACNEIESLPIEIGALVSLEYQFLKGNVICSIPEKALYKMKALKVLDLSPPYNLVKKEKQHKLGFSSLVELKELLEFGALGIDINDMMQFQWLCELWNVPVRWLTITILEELSTFSFPSWFLESFQSRRNLFSLSITNMEAEWVNFDCTYGNPSRCELKRLEHLYIYRVRMKAILWGAIDGPKNILPFLKCITISMCDRLENISWVVHLPCLRELTVSVCPRIHLLIHTYKISEQTFPLLKLLVLEGLPKLNCIGDRMINFPALETLKIFGCIDLKNFPFSRDNIPSKLNHIWVEEEWWNNIEWSQDSFRSSLCEHVRFLY